jgi:N4-gp56 family major capsid protein
MAVSNSTTLNDLVGQIVSADAQSYAYSARVMRPLIRAIAVPPGAGSITVPRFDEVTVGPLVEGVAPTASAMTTTGVTLTPTERGVYKQISKRVLHADPFSDLAPYGQQMGLAMAQDEDSLILDEATFTTRVNNTSSAMTMDAVLEAIATLEGMNAPQPYYAVFHPGSWAKLRKAMADASTFGTVGQQIVGGMGQGFVNMAGYVGSPFGIPSFISTQVNTASGDSRRENIVFSASSIACAYIQDIGVDVDDNVVARAIDLMGWYSVDCANINDFGVVIEDTV